MSSVFAAMKSVCSLPLKAQIPRLQLKPAHLARFSSTATENVESVKNMKMGDYEIREIDTNNSSASEDNEKYINEVKLLGRIAAPPQIISNVDRPYAFLKLVTKRRVKNSVTGEFENMKDWHTLMTNQERHVEIIQKTLKEGQRVFVNGKLSYGFTRSGEKYSRVHIFNIIPLGD